MDCADLRGHTILVVEEEPLIALELRAALEEAGAQVVVTRDVSDSIARIRETSFSGAVIDWRPGSDHHRRVARALRQRSVLFVFCATNPPEDVTTVRGAPVVLKPAHPGAVAKALALLRRVSSNESKICPPGHAGGRINSASG